MKTFVCTYIKDNGSVLNFKTKAQTTYYARIKFKSYLIYIGNIINEDSVLRIKPFDTIEEF